jgi:ParB family chromosome partitioning protein
MAKKFAARVTKKERKTVDLSDKIKRDLYKLADESLLEDARLLELNIKDIVVKDQVRTKFNDASIKELAANIKTNGLIQPLVVHEENGKYVLICGERRFRAMSTLTEMKTCPCFVLEDKSPQELMAIQFSENSSREALHYIDKADGILNYQKATKASERKITAALGISKSEVHRSLLIAKMSKKIKEAAKAHNIEKYVLLEFDALEAGTEKTSIARKIYKGEITKRAQLKRVINAGSKVKKRAAPRKKPVLPAGFSANAFLKAMETQSKDMDAETAKALKALVEKTKQAVEN